MLDDSLSKLKSKLKKRNAQFLREKELDSATYGEPDLTVEPLSLDII